MLPELLEQLDCAPPEPDDELASEPLGNDAADPAEEVLGPLGLAAAKAGRPELVDALELVEQLPELPLTCDGEIVSRVLEELLQVYAMVVFGNDVVRNTVVTKTTIPLIRNNLFIFVLVIGTIKIHWNTLQATVMIYPV